MFIDNSQYTSEDESSNISSVFRTSGSDLNDTLDNLSDKFGQGKQFDIHMATSY